MNIRVAIRRLLSEERFLLTEGKNDPGIFKVIFMAGGPGSGKGTILRELLGASSSSFTPQGLKIVNSDALYELLLKKSGVGVKDPGGLSREEYEKLSPEEQEEYNTAKKAYRSISGALMSKATKAVTGGVSGIDPEQIGLDRKDFGMKKIKSRPKSQLEMHVDGRLGLIVDGTAANYTKIMREKKILETLGYDTMMIAVSVPVETAIDRNKARGEAGGRAISRKAVERTCSRVQQSIEKYETDFENFVLIDNTRPTSETLTSDVFKKVNNFISSKPKRTSALDWLNKQ